MRLIIFDVDGTLLDSQHQILAAQARAFAALGLPAPSRERSLSIVGLSLHEAFAVLVGADGPIDALSAAYKAAWFELRAAPGFADTLYPGAADLIADLAREPDAILGIATGKSRAGVDRVVSEHGWHGLFATIQTADTHPSKPDPSMIFAALAETGASAKATTMIGDTSFDMLMAVAAGVRPVGVAWGYQTRAELRGAGATTIAETFADLRRLLRSDASAAA